jgi:hypothetical protein
MSKVAQKIFSSKFQTKVWRTSQPWYSTGKHNECELYQKRLVKQITGQALVVKKGLRINKTDGSFLQDSRPGLRKDFFELTEDFDGIQDESDTNLYFNLKMVCDRGGSQTRTLSLVYEFILAQFLHLSEYGKEDKYFINILDGDESSRFKPKFQYLLGKEKYKDLRTHVFVGDMAEFQDWFNKKFTI